MSAYPAVVNTSLTSSDSTRCLFVGNGGARKQQVPQGLTGDEPEGVKYESRRTDRSDRGSRDKKRRGVKHKDWILQKKDVRFRMALIAHDRDY